MRFLIDRSWGTDAASPVLGAWKMARRLPASQHERLLLSLITFFTRTLLHVYLRRGVVRLAAPEMVRWYDACLSTVTLHEAGGVRAAGVLALSSHFDRIDHEPVSG